MKDIDFDNLEVPYIYPRGVDLSAMLLFLEGVEKGFFNIKSIESTEEKLFYEVDLFGPKVSEINKYITQALDLNTYVDFCNKYNVDLELSANEIFSDKITIHLIENPIVAVAALSWENKKPKVIHFKYNMFMNLVDERIEPIIMGTLKSMRLERSNKKASK